MGYKITRLGVQGIRSCFYAWYLAPRRSAWNWAGRSPPKARYTSRMTMEIPGSDSGSREAGGETTLEAVAFSALLLVGRTAKGKEEAIVTSEGNPQTQHQAQRSLPHKCNNWRVEDTGAMKETGERGRGW